MSEPVVAGHTIAFTTRCLNISGPKRMNYKDDDHAQTGYVHGHSGSGTSVVYDAWHTLVYHII